MKYEVDNINIIKRKKIESNSLVYNCKNIFYN